MFVAVLPIIVLLGVIALQAIYSNDFRPYVPLILGAVTALAIGMKRGIPWKKLSKETFQTVGSVSSALVLYMIIGPTISVWMASGTLPTLILWGSEVLTPMTYLPISFLIMGLVTILMGTGMTSIGTMGVALVSIGLACGYPIWLLAAVLGSGAFWGNACSPMSGINLVSLTMTEADSGDFVYYMIPRLLPPFIVCIIAYAVMGVVYKPESTGQALSHFEALAQVFPPSIISIIPIVVLVVLLLRRVPSLIVFFTTIVVSCIVAVAMGYVSISQLPGIIVSGYRYTGENMELRALLNRGGIMSTVSIVYTVMVAMLFGGSFKASGCLNQLMESLTKHVKGVEGLRRMAMGCTIVTTLVTSSSTMGTALSGALFTPKMKEEGLNPEEATATLGPTAAMVSPLIPWGAAGTAVITFLGVPLSDPKSLLYIPFSFCCFLGPLWLFIKKPKKEVVAKTQES